MNKDARRANSGWSVSPREDVEQVDIEEVIAEAPKKAKKKPAEEVVE